jgi:hypothetical protein
VLILRIYFGMQLIPRQVAVGADLLMRRHHVCCSLPADLVHLLISRVGLGEAEVAAMNKEDAVARLQRYWIEGR